MKEWTLMFYFASDGPLAPGIVSQLKSIKNAGYHPEANVVAYFDPQPVGTPAHVFDVNAIYKLIDPEPRIGFDPNDPFVRSLIDDRLWRDEKDRNGKKIRDLIIDQLKKKKNRIYNRPEAPKPLATKIGAQPSTNHHEKSEPGAQESLETFLNFCAENYQAKHYMLFILGHGLVVGDDVFLFDEHATEQSVTLRGLGHALDSFKTLISGWGELELVSFHSCSMSSLEVAFELQGTANYMLASQGPAFVGSWPYREILLRVFNEVEKGTLKTPQGVKKMFGNIFDYVYHNSTDYLLAGYPFDLCLCDLSELKLAAVVEPLKELSRALVEALKNLDNPLANYCILLAHWKSQSHWQQNYTDLFDFCFCLDGYCADFVDKVNDPSSYTRIQDACVEVMRVLEKSSLNNPVIRADSAGPDSQYSHGLSVFFPWTRPISDRVIVREGEESKTEYELYRFNQTEWFSFLDQYWGPQESDKPVEGSTMRAPHKEELKDKAPSADDALFEDIASLMFNANGALNTASALGPGDKVNPPDPTGDECTCGSIKNYRRDTRARAKRGDMAEAPFPVNHTAFAD